MTIFRAAADHREVERAASGSIGVGFRSKVSATSVFRLLRRKEWTAATGLAEFEFCIDVLARPCDRLEEVRRSLGFPSPNRETAE